MLFERFFATARAFSDRPCLDGHTYAQVLALIEAEAVADPVVVEANDWRAVVAILAAARRRVPCIVPPSSGRAEAYPDLPRLPAGRFSLTLFSSGTTRAAHPVVQPESMILANARVAAACQGLVPDDAVLTVSSLHHAGGLHVQTLPALLVGASVTVRRFDAFAFLPQLARHTVSHLAPAQAQAVMRTKGWQTFRAPGVRLIACGSDVVPETVAAGFVARGMPFMVNYGMTEAGPLILNHRFDAAAEVARIYRNGVPLGTRAWCEVEVRAGELFLRGDNVCRPGWFATGDGVHLIGGCHYCQGRRAA